MTVSIATNDMDQAKLSLILNSLLVDITAQKTALGVLATKLNADATVTDTDYASSGALTTVV